MNLLVSTSLKTIRSLRSPHSFVRHIQSTVNKDEINHFSKLSSQWWDENGEFSILHRMNPVRVQYIVEKLQEAEEAKDIVSSRYGARALSGLDILDVGCGGGLLSEVLHLS